MPEWPVARRLSTDAAHSNHGNSLAMCAAAVLAAEAAAVAGVGAVAVVVVVPASIRMHRCHEPSLKGSREPSVSMAPVHCAQ